MGEKMSLPQSKLKDFLKKYCPDPTLIQSAIDRLGLWAIQELNPDDFICHANDRADACWIIVSGDVEIRSNDNHIVLRRAGEMIGEQAFITTLVGKEPGCRTADMVARSDLKLICFDAALQEKFTPDERAIWSLTLAAVINEKLTQATEQRVKNRRLIEDREELLGRFADGEALGIVRKAIEEETQPVENREVIIWFSDITNFSTWAADKPPAKVACLARRLTGVQIDQIRKSEGFIDKLMGDGVMAVWFIDTVERKDRLPEMAVECARNVAAEIDDLLQNESLGNELSIRIGLHSGKACFGDFGSQGRIAVTVLGHDINIAARYEQARSEDALGAVRVSPSLKALVEKNLSPHSWSFGPARVVKVKHEVPLEIFPVKEEG